MSLNIGRKTRATNLARTAYDKATELIIVQAHVPITNTVIARLEAAIALVVTILCPLILNLERTKYQT